MSDCEHGKMHHLEFILEIVNNFIRDLKSLENEMKQSNLRKQNLSHAPLGESLEPFPDKTVDSIQTCKFIDKIITSTMGNH